MLRVHAQTWEASIIPLDQWRQGPRNLSGQPTWLYIYSMHLKLVDCALISTLETSENTENGKYFNYCNLLALWSSTSSTPRAQKYPLLLVVSCCWGWLPAVLCKRLGNGMVPRYVFNSGDNFRPPVWIWRMQWILYHCNIVILLWM